jgi:hypothetical protein
MKDQLDRQMMGLTRRSLLSGGAAALAGVAAWQWLRTRPLDDGVPWPLRKGLDANGRFAQGYFGEARTARTFSSTSVQSLPVNGVVGIEDDPAGDWSLSFGARLLSLGDIQALPKIAITTELKCIEGWSRVVQWGGARFRDFVARFDQGGAAQAKYVALETPNADYYIGLDMASAMHPQTLLCYEMNGQPLSPGHGAPLRLVIPVKYGIKNLKRIGRIDFSDSRPRDYWAERGYDWYAGF